ncbi:glutamyl-tRNA synthetase [Pontibacter ummariensis]|uniref:Glutamyl-tRNA synthetase n=1 Tax=Pontibacter ummariensis TaxID=1610492 RepID=A0A239IJA1_9BACT|nr:glutamate--tRNA ligase family protein [Pontibacter ummariensis]PRY09873.1 glutamyl-tRNA synthetase [Pontibacter ummariensis]SNS93609.1 glutamyl-tRNA synthetase [Pontibacter ummariensis]
MEQHKQPIAPAPLKTRLAPTPSGYLHLGNALSFALTWALARKSHGTLALRIDDLDNTRFREEYLQDIFDTIRFLGIDYDEGPQDARDFLEHYSQHRRLSQYQEMLEQLSAQGLLYACPCSRSQITAVSPQGLYPLTCRAKGLPLSQPGTAWRIRVPEDTVISFQDLLLGRCHIPLGQEMPDFVVRRKDGVPAYQVASVCDDLLMGITHLVRGQDLLASTAAQLFLAQCAGESSFATMQFLHHPILLEPDGNKLSKSHDSLSINQMRKQGLASQGLWQKIAQVLGWQDAEIGDAQSFLERFRLADVPSQPRKISSSDC